MEHPLITDIDHLTMEQLQSKISELQKKLTYAQRTGNGHLAGQIRMAIETFSNRYQDRLQAMYEEQNKNSPDHSDKINIS